MHIVILIILMLCGEMLINKLRNIGDSILCFRVNRVVKVVCVQDFGTPGFVLNVFRGNSS